MKSDKSHFLLFKLEAKVIQKAQLMEILPKTLNAFLCMVLELVHFKSRLEDPSKFASFTFFKTTSLSLSHKN